ncbi:MAG: 2OG-Fe(II) oxygenase [Lysobacter sp.]
MTQDVKYEASEQRFIRSRVTQGCTLDAVRSDLASMGWHPESIRRAVDRFAAGGPAESGPPRPRPEPDLDRLPTQLCLDGHEVQVQLRIHHPRVCLLSNFLSASECAELIEQSRPRMERSRVIVGDGEVDEDGVLAYSRTSDQATIQRGASELVDRIQRRVALLTRWPEDCMESAQIVRYRTGADFAPHHDFFCPDAHKDLIAREGQRVGTVLMYLNTPASGGATAFPDVELEVYPQQGNALFFGYPHAHADSLTMHAGVPLGSAEKWIATFFLRDRAVGLQKDGGHPQGAV